AEGSGLEALGVTSDQIVGGSVFERFPDLPTALRDLERVFAGESFVAMAEGRGRVLEMRYMPERDRAGRVVGASGITFDVTDRSRAETALQRAQAVVHRMLSTA